MDDYEYIFGRKAEDWREPLGALRLTLTGDPQTQWRLRDAGNPVLHGHTHSTEKVSFSACGTPQLHVGWDAWGRPVRFHEIVALLKGAE